MRRVQAWGRLLETLMLGFLIVGWVGCVTPNTNSTESLSQVCFQGHCVKVEIADSPAERAQGLMFRSALGEIGGMLFVFEEESLHGFWMKNT